MAVTVAYEIRTSCPTELLDAYLPEGVEYTYLEGTGTFNVGDDYITFSGAGLSDDDVRRHRLFFSWVNERNDDEDGVPSEGKFLAVDEDRLRVIHRLHIDPVPPEWGPKWQPRVVWPEDQ